MPPDLSVTIAIPTFNRAALLKECLSRLLPQIGPGVEVLVSDNASTDETRDVLGHLVHPQLRVSRNAENIGLFGNLNQCLALAKGRYIIFLSDDDILDDDLISSCAAFLAEDDQTLSAVVAANRYLTRAADGKTYISAVESKVTSGVYAGEAILQDLWFGRISFQLCGVMFQTDALRAIGGFSLDHRYAADLLAFAKVFFRRRIAFIASPKSTYVVHERSESSLLGLRYRLDDLSAVFREIVDDARLKLERGEAAHVRASVRCYMGAEYLRNIVAYRKAGGRRRDCVAAMPPMFVWMGRGSRAMRVLPMLVEGVFTPLWLREFVWTLRRWVKRRPGKPDGRVGAADL